jgi:hypothetical protein
MAEPCQDDFLNLPVPQLLSLCGEADGVEKLGCSPLSGFTKLRWPLSTWSAAQISELAQIFVCET